MKLSFRRLQREDFHLLSLWFSRSHVEPWWREAYDLESIECHYGPAVDGADPTELFIVELDSEPVGFAQLYLLDDNPGWKESLAPAGMFDDAAGIDYVIGPEAAIGKGLGPRVIDRLVEHAWEENGGLQTVVVSVDQANRRSWRALEKAGFERVWAGQIVSDDPSDSGTSFVYVRRRPVPSQQGIIKQVNIKPVPRVLAAPDKYRGTLSARDAAAAIGRAAAAAGWECDIAPVSDGGEGFLEVFADFGHPQTARAAGPLGQELQVPWVLGHDPDDALRPVAVVESALAIGLATIGGPSRNDPMRASSAGLGHVVAAAARAGAKQVLIGMGGSATTDGGLGAVDVLAPNGRRPSAELLVACDVETEFLDAAAIFSPQKGAAPSQVELLKRRLERVAQLYQERFGVDVRSIKGSGAAGGLGGGLAAIGAKLVPGFDLVAEKLSLADRVARADLVVTGEGFLDKQSFAGKAVGGVAHLAGQAGVPVLVVAGDGEAGSPIPFVSLVERFGRDRSFESPGPCITEVVAERLGGPEG